MQDPSIIPARSGILELLDYAGLEDRIADLEAMLRQYRDIATIGIHESHAAHIREQKRRATVRSLTATIRAQRQQIIDLERRLRLRDRRAA